MPELKKEDVYKIGYKGIKQELYIHFKDGHYTRRVGVNVDDMKPYYDLLKSKGEEGANAYVVDMVNEKFREKPQPRFQVGKAYLNDFTIWDDPKPIGKGEFGDIYDQFKGRMKSAFDFIIKTKNADLLGIFHRDSHGDIDLVWGDKKGGLKHIIDKHVGMGKSFISITKLAERLDYIIKYGRIEFENGDKVVLKDGTELVTVRKNIRKGGKKIADKNWVLTAYDEASADNGNSAITGIIQGKAAPTTDASVAQSYAKFCK